MAKTNYRTGIRTSNTLFKKKCGPKHNLLEKVGPKQTTEPEYVRLIHFLRKGWTKTQPFGKG